MAKKVAKKSVSAAKKRPVAPKSKKAKAKSGKKIAKAKPAAKKAVKKSAKEKPAGASSAKSASTKGVQPKRLTKSPLTKSQLAEFREMLMAKRRDLIGDMNGIQAEALSNNDSDLSNMPTHPADIGTDNFEQEFTLGLLESERALLTELEDALVRLAEGMYGVCIGTGQAIGLARLRARPWAKYSIEYARLLEQGLVTPLGADDEEDDD